MIFPIIQPKLYPQESKLPMFREAAWDYKENIPIWRDGSPVMVEGAEAVAVWAYNALQTPRCRHEIYSWDYADELESLIGSGCSDAVQQAEAVRMVKECLLVSPYISEVRDVLVSFVDSRLSISAKLITVYGEVNLNV